MLLNEIFDTRNKVTWKETKKGYIGQFVVDDDDYFIDVEEYEINLDSGIKSGFDVGFRKGNLSELTNDKKPARVLGSVLNGVAEKVKKDNPNIVMFGALSKYGFVDERKVIYRKIVSLIIKVTKYNYVSDWYDFAGGSYMFMADFNLTEKDREIINKFIEDSYHK